MSFWRVRSRVDGMYDLLHSCGRVLFERVSVRKCIWAMCNSRCHCGQSKQ